MIFLRNLAQHEKALQQKYEVSTSIWHKGERGRQRENGLAMFLREMLPVAYGVATGEIIPYVGQKPSPQCDIIIYDALRTIIFGRNESVQQVPLEGVYAVIEVKSALDSKAIKDAKKKFAKIRTLPRCPNRVPLKEGFRREPVYFLFGYKLATTEQACKQYMQQALDSQGAASDAGIVALNHGLGIYIEQPQQPTMPVWLRTSEEKTGFHETLMYFLVSLLRELETIDLGIPDYMHWTGEQ